MFSPYAKVLIQSAIMNEEYDNSEVVIDIKLLGLKKDYVLEFHLEKNLLNDTIYASAFTTARAGSKDCIYDGDHFLLLPMRKFISNVEFPDR